MDIGSALRALHAERNRVIRMIERLEKEQAERKTRKTREAQRPADRRSTTAASAR